MQATSQQQLASAVILFQLGSSPLFLLAGPAKGDAWIAVFVGMLAGAVLLLTATLQIYRKEPNLSLIELLPKYFGRVLGTAIALAYIFYFTYKSVRNVREFGDLLNAFLLPNTPLVFLLFMVVLLSAYAVYHGADVFFRLTELVLPWIVFFYALVICFVLLTNLVHLENMEPVLERGLKPVVAAALPELISFPFGEMVLFLMFWRMTDSVSRTFRTTIMAFLFAGLFLVIANALILSVLGKMSFFTVIPLLQMTNLINVGGIVERLDPIILLLLFTGVYLKQTAYFLGAVLALSQLSGSKWRRCIPPIGILIFAGALAFRSYMEQVRIGFKLNLNYHFPIFQIVIPYLILAVILIRSFKSRRAEN
ncbi:GerAB/ArcD/ProY family transporter [Cohnella sp. AR92]|uniref:GerAB/ArcD/ProY family transporter n=1 Tax=Cohnella sp. AR92 TaxID=648716 RepID=UPI000F8DCC44|nr:GerAB/ArcD/ProY family transporter [Cohnella sp. AR92]RUS46768.1 spore gernimation protein [Cohnella sp. AR92]